MTIKPKTRRLRAVRSSTDLEARGVPFVPDAPDLQAISQERATERPADKPAHLKIALSDHVIDGRIDMAEGRTVWLYDQGGPRSVPGLRLRIGPRSAAWVFVRDRVDHGKRKALYETLGRFDRGTRTENPVRHDWHVTTDAARDAASVKAGHASRPGATYKAATSRTGKTFAQAFEAYLIHLREKAEDEGKPPRWMKHVAKLGKSLLLPQFGKWTMLELSTRRADRGDGLDSVESWYREIRTGRVTSANHCVKILRAVYLREAKRDSSLPGDPTQIPSAGVTLRKENWQRKGVVKPGMARKDFPAWLAKWRTLAPIKRAYHLVNLLTGARPGELARTPWTNLDTKSRTFTIGNAKIGNDIPVPLSSAICRALKLARDNADKSGLIFPGCEQSGHHETVFTKAERGHSHRRTWKTVSVDCGIPDELSAYVLGHIPDGVSARYAIRQVLLQGRMLRKHQATVSRRVVEWLGSDPTL
jgi:integrase